jgi:hypothetical protein
LECTPEEPRPISTSPTATSLRGRSLTALDRADGEACKVVVALGVHARHFRRLAADERAAGLAAALGDAGDDVSGDADVELAGCKVIEEEQRLAPWRPRVVDAHGDEIDADRAVLAGLDGDLELGADAVVGGDQDRIAKPARLQIEQAAEAAEVASAPGPCGRFGQRLDRLDQGVAGIDIDPALNSR